MSANVQPLQRVRAAQHDLAAERFVLAWIRDYKRVAVRIIYKRELRGAAARLSFRRSRRPRHFSGLGGFAKPTIAQVNGNRTSVRDPVPSPSYVGIAEEKEDSHRYMRARTLGLNA